MVDSDLESVRSVGTPLTIGVNPSDAPSQALKCQATLTPQFVTPTTSSSNESPLDLRLSTLMKRTKKDPVLGKWRRSSTEFMKKIQDIKEDNTISEHVQNAYEKLRRRKKRSTIR